MKPLGATAMSTEASDEQLVAMAQAGSSEAFASLFRRYRPAIARYAGRMLGDDARAEDVVQEVFLSALRSIDTLDRPAGFRAWLYRIAHNTCVDHVRRRGRAEEISIDVNRLPASEEIRLFRQAPSTHAALTQKQDFQNLREAFGGLPASQSEVLVMRELEGLSYDQIAVRMGISRASVESMLFRARQGLRDEYGQIATGERCVRMRPVMARMAEGLGGLRDRRALARHVRGCHPCRRDAAAMGLAGPALDAAAAGGLRRGLSRVAALLPLPWFVNRRPDETGGAASSAGGGGGSSIATHAQTAVTHLSSTMSVGTDHAATALQKAVAVVAAVAVVGGGGYAASQGDRREELFLKGESTAVPARADVGPDVPPALLPFSKAGATAQAGVPGGPARPVAPIASASPGAPAPSGFPGPLKTPATPLAGAAPGAPLTGVPGANAPSGGGTPDGITGGEPTVPSAGETGGGTGTGTGEGTSGGSGGGTGGGASSGGGGTGGGSGGTDPTTNPGGGTTTPSPGGDQGAEPCKLPKGLAKQDKLPPGHERKGCVISGAVTEPAP